MNRIAAIVMLSACGVADTDVDTKPKASSVIVDGDVVLTDGVDSPLPTASALACSTFGAQNVAVIVVVPPGATPEVSNAQLATWFFGATPSVDGYIRDASFDQASVTGAVFGPYTLDRAYGCNEYSSVTAKAIALADADIFYPDFQRIFIVYPPGEFPTACSWNGLSEIGCVTTSANSTDGPRTVSTSWLNSTSLVNGGPNHGPSDAVTLAVHELGHSLGLLHAHSIDYGAEPVAALAVPLSPFDDYGDLHSVMGGGRVFGFGRFTQYAAPHKARLGWIDGQVLDASAPGTFTLSPYEGPLGPGARALKIRRPGTTDQSVWLEYRQPIGDYESTALPGAFDGVLIHLGQDTDAATQLVDMRPDSAELDFEDAALAVGSSWVDPYTGLGIAIAPAGSDLAVTITYDAASCTSAAPDLVASPASTIAGQPANLAISIANHDTGLCPATQAFGLSRSAAPPNWPLASGSLAFVPNGGTASGTIVQPTFVTMHVGVYNVTVASPRGTTNASTNATITIVPTVTASAPGTQFPRNTTVALSAQVLDGNVGASAVPVTFTLDQPNNTTTTTKTTNTTGVATWTYKVNQRGVYTLRASATVAGKTGTSPGFSFTVN